MADVYHELRITVAHKKLELALRALDGLICTIETIGGMPDVLLQAKIQAQKTYLDLENEATNLHK